MTSSSVLHATDQLSDGVLAFLALATRELIQAGVQQTVLFSGRGDTPSDVAERFDPHVRLVEIGRPTAGIRWSFQRALRDALRAELTSHAHDGVHLHGARAGFVGRLALSSAPDRPPLYYSPHGLSSLNDRRPMAGAVSGFLERVAGLSACQVVGCGEGEALELARLTGRAATVLENPVDPSFLELQRAPDPRARVITVGRVCEQKGPTQFAELAARFHYAGEPAQFVWVGAGDTEAEQVLRAAGVEVTGWLDAAAVRAQMARAHVYVQASHWEGMPLPLLQAMAAGLPCVVTDVVGNRDAVTHDATGLVARDVSCLAMHVKVLLDQPARARELGGQAQREAQRRFHPRRFRRALLSLYRLDGAGQPVVDYAPGTAAP